MYVLRVAGAFGELSAGVNEVAVFDEDPRRGGNGVLPLFALFVDNLELILLSGDADDSGDAGNDLFRDRGGLALRLGAGGKHGAGDDVDAILDEDLALRGDVVFLDEGVDVADADDAPFVLLYDLHGAVDLADDGLALGSTGLKQFFDAGRLLVMSAALATPPV
jgi:hypothetical protein